MTQNSASITKVALIGALAGLLVLSGCGRKGSLDQPGTVPADPVQTGAVPETNAEEPESPPKEDRPFILDAIL